MIVANSVSSGVCWVPPPCGHTRSSGINGLASSHKPSGTIQLHVPRPMNGPRSDHHIGHRLKEGAGQPGRERRRPARRHGDVPGVDRRVQPARTTGTTCAGAPVRAPRRSPGRPPPMPLPRVPGRPPGTPPAVATAAGLPPTYESHDGEIRWGQAAWQRLTAADMPIRSGDGVQRRRVSVAAATQPGASPPSPYAEQRPPRRLKGPAENVGRSDES
jgi:hypothetical protein